MNLTKKILLPEKDNQNIKKAIKLCKKIQGIELLTTIKINYEWFKKEDINFKNLSDSELILINSFLALKNKYVDGLIVGIDYNSKDVFKCCIKILNENKKILSSCFVVSDKRQISVWGDCAFNIEPNIDMAYANICDMVTFTQLITNNQINVALLSYSSESSGAGILINSINELSQKLKQNYINDLNIRISNNIQFDAAMNKKISIKKNIKFYKPNVLWFPNLMSGNIGYKIAQHYGKLNFAGPFILGLNYWVSDLSRGATIDDIILTIKIMAKCLILLNN